MSSHHHWDVLMGRDVSWEGSARCFVQSSAVVDRMSAVRESHSTSPKTNLRRGGVERYVRLQGAIGLALSLGLLIRVAARATEVAPVQRHWVEAGPVDECVEHEP
jgi:hypothetical protein